MFWNGTRRSAWGTLALTSISGATLLPLLISKIARLGGVVDHVADVAQLDRAVEHAPGLGRPVVRLRLAHQVAGRRHALDELAAPDAVDVRRDLAAEDHLAQAGRDDVVLDAQLVVLVARVGAHALGDELEELGQPL